jgi:predicted DNA-binding WGR domain protein
VGRPSERGYQPQWRLAVPELSWQPTLFGDGALVKSWGRLGTEGRSATVFWGERQDAQAVIDQLVRRRVQHGYQLVASSS